jgi:hypothetical protein
VLIELDFSAGATVVGLAAGAGVIGFAAEAGAGGEGVTPSAIAEPIIRPATAVVTINVFSILDPPSRCSGNRIPSPEITRRHQRCSGKIVSPAPHHWHFCKLARWAADGTQPKFHRHIRGFVNDSLSLSAVNP